MIKQLPRQDGQFPYIKLFVEEYLGGSLHYGCNLEEQGFFVCLLCLAAKNRKERGTFSLEKGKPMSTAMIANALFISEEACEILLAVMEVQERIHYRDDGVLVITNFDFYQSRYRRSKAKKDEARSIMIARTEKQRLALYTNKYPNTAIRIIQESFGYTVIDNKTGEIKEKVVEESEDSEAQYPSAEDVDKVNAIMERRDKK